MAARRKAGAKALINKLRKFCLSLPETREDDPWDHHPVWKAGEKIFASAGEHEGRPSMGCKATKPDQKVLLTDPRFFFPSYVGKHGWIGLWLDDAVEWDLVEQLVVDSYRLVALKRMIKALDTE